MSHQIWLRRGVASIVALAVVLPAAWFITDSASWSCAGTENASEIFQGVTYGCRRLSRSEEGSGTIHWVRIDMTAPGIELYVTPLDAAAVARGWQYRLRRLKDVLNQENLAVAINGTLFTSDSNRLIRLPGDFANSVETVVADRVVSHIWEHTYLLWFDGQWTPHLRSRKPPSAEELATAKWGIGGQAVWLQDGRLSPAADRDPNSRTAVAIDGPRRLLYLAIGQHISPRLLLKVLADLGARDGMLLDGGGSTALAVGLDAKGIQPGQYGGWRPVATQFGVRARPFPR